LELGIGSINPLETNMESIRDRIDLTIDLDLLCIQIHDISKDSITSVRERIHPSVNDSSQSQGSNIFLKKADRRDLPQIFACEGQQNRVKSDILSIG